MAMANSPRTNSWAVRPWAVVVAVPMGLTPVVRLLVTKVLARTEWAARMRAAPALMMLRRKTRPNKAVG